MQPTNITVNRSIGEMIIMWSDGHTSNYPFRLLRQGCPCASCRGGHANMRSDPDEAVFKTELPDSPKTRIRNVEAAGSYGIILEWEDGHHFGIYNWNYLRKLCPCSACRNAAG